MNAERSSWRKRTARAAGCLMVLLSALLQHAGQVHGTTVFAGNIKLVQGVTESSYVKILRPGFTKILVGKPGEALFEGDTIKTDAGVKAQIELTDQTVISLAPGSNLKIAGYMAERTASRRNTVFKALQGTIRFVVSKIVRSNGDGGRKWKDSSVTVETLNAVAGVRGTDFFVTPGEQDVEFAVLEGVVGVRSVMAGGNGEILVGANQKSLTRMGGRAGRAEPLSPERREQLRRMTTLEKAMSQLNAALAKALAAKKKYDSGAIARDLAAGKPLSAVIDRAVEAGVPIEDIIAAAIDAGANRGLVVYTCIQEGQVASTVVEAAIETGVPLNVVFIAAVSAGADQQAVITGAEGAGISPEAIAGTLASTTIVAPDTIGSITPEMPTTPGAVMPPAVITIGGGGGTPSASPYVP